MPKTRNLDLPCARANVCHSQVGAADGNFWVDIVAEDLAPQGVHQVDTYFLLAPLILVSEMGTTHRLLSRKSRVNT